jgi:Fur family ferric uptake transcriptional regulator
MSRKKLDSPRVAPRAGESLVDRLRDKGVRLTEQRRVLAELLDRAEQHLDADAVYKLARKRDPSIHRATVYRTLNMLKSHGLVDELDLMHVAGDRHYYEVRPSVFHIHLVCIGCGGVQEPGGRFWEDLKRKVTKETGFRPEIVRLEMGGQCSECHARRSRKPA